MKKILIILLTGFMLFAFVGCDNKEVTYAPSEPEIIQLVDYDKSNFTIYVDYSEHEEENNIKVFVDGKLCENEKVLGDFGHKYISYHLNLDENSHNVTVAVDNIMHSSVNFKISNECQWLWILHPSSQVSFNLGKGLIPIE
ncbi:MAG: hypothetical protein RR891_07035 [Clostridium sp.]|uniref:hypothetical protein n=1 Tax=Clostridium sp. TaxID=1506 RepID=UPI003051DD11